MSSRQGLEEAIVGMLIVSADNWAKCVNVPEHFSDFRLRTAFKVLSDFRAHDMSWITKESLDLFQKSLFDRGVRDQGFLKELIELAPVPDLFEEMSQELKDLAS